MNKKIIFNNKNFEDICKVIHKNDSRKMVNFLNQHDLYQSKNNQDFFKILTSKDSLNFIDGATISFFLSIKNLKKVRRMRGPTFTREFLSHKAYSQNKKHFFIGFDDESIKKIKQKIKHLKYIKGYNPPYVKGIKFLDDEVKKISKMINLYNPDYVWVGVGSPKQNFLSNSLFKKTNAKYYFNIGAAMDFLLNKKKEAPKFFQVFGLEWFYRLITDFKHTKVKVYRSFVGLKYLNLVKIKK